MDFLGSHILSIDQFELRDVERLFEVASQMEPFARRVMTTRVLEGAVLGNLFFESSTRSRFSFASAFERLGGTVRDMVGFENSSFEKGESVYDTCRVIAGYVDAIVVRHPEVGRVHEFARATHIPVINSGDGTGEHPTQALLDLYTVQKELGVPVSAIQHLRIALVGDLKHGRTVHSLTKLMSLLPSVEFRLVAPGGLELPGDLIEYLRQKGHITKQTRSLIDGIKDADIVYCTRLQEERFASREEASRYRGMYSINRTLFEAHCRPSTVLMHPLPRDSRIGKMELDVDLNRLPALAIFRQADNGIPLRMALFVLVLGVSDRVAESARPVHWYVPDHFGTDDPR